MIGGGSEGGEGGRYHLKGDSNCTAQSRLVDLLTISVYTYYVIISHSVHVLAFSAFGILH